MQGFEKVLVACITVVPAMTFTALQEFLCLCTSVFRVHCFWPCGWRRGSVVRTSVFGWHALPGLCLIYG